MHKPIATPDLYRLLLEIRRELSEHDASASHVTRRATQDALTAAIEKTRPPDFEQFSADRRSIRDEIGRVLDLQDVTLPQPDPEAIAGMVERLIAYKLGRVDR